MKAAIYPGSFDPVTYGHLDVWSEWTGLFYLSLPRTWAGLCMGGLCYFLSEKLKNIPFSKAGLIILWSVKMLCITGAFFYMLTRYRRRLDFLCVGMLFAALVITVSKTQRSCKNCGNYLNELSLALYVSHWTIRAVVPAVMLGAAYEEMLGVYLFLSVLYASMFVAGVKAVQKLSLPERLKRHFLLQGCE